MSLLRHIVDIHEWNCATEYMRCGHAPLSSEERNKKAWLKSDSAARKALQGIVMDKHFLRSLEQISLLLLLFSLAVVLPLISTTP